MRCATPYPIEQLCALGFCHTRKIADGHCARFDLRREHGRARQEVCRCVEQHAVRRRGKSGLRGLRGVARNAAPRNDLPPGLGPLTDLLRVLLKLRCEDNDVAQKLVANSSELEMIAVAPELQRRGLRSAMVWNDQGKDLVDSRYAALSGMHSGEVTGGCFCCRRRRTQAGTQRRPDSREAAAAAAAL